MRGLAARLFELIWWQLPDKCEMPGCCRQGVRGNENVVAGKIMCDYCHARYLYERGIPVSGFNASG